MKVKELVAESNLPKGYVHLDTALGEVRRIVLGGDAKGTHAVFRSIHTNLYYIFDETYELGSGAPFEVAAIVVG